MVETLSTRRTDTRAQVQVNTFIQSVYNWMAIGLGLTLIHLISIPITNTSVNPARSTGPALLVGGWAVAQLWMFWVAPLIGAAVAGLVYRWFEKD